MPAVDNVAATDNPMIGSQTYDDTFDANPLSPAEFLARN